MSIDAEAPAWIKKLFILFTTNYREKWTDYVKDDMLLKAAIYSWTESLKGFSADLIFKAGMEIIKNSKYPPSISEFLEMINTLSKNQRMDNTSQKLLSEDYKASPPSPLVMEDMLLHPPEADDEFKTIFDNYRGEERGKRMIMLIKSKLRAKVVRS